MRRRRIAWTAVGLLFTVLLLGGIAVHELTRVSPARSIALPDAMPADPAERGALLFVHGDLGTIDLDTLETSALPWTVLTAALGLDAAGGEPGLVTADLVEDRFRAFGFLYPETPAPGVLPMQPYGLTIGRIERVVPPLRVTAANLGCAACHSGVSYDGEGRPDPAHPVAGAPSASLDLEAYSQGVYAALVRALADETALWAAIDRLHPDLTVRERATLRFLVLPRARERMAALAAAGLGPLPFANGFPGHTNGVSALRNSLGLERGVGTGFVSVPDLADRSFRSSFLADGAYAPPGEPRFSPRTREEADAADPMVLARIGSFFTVPSMGVSPERAEAAIADFADIVRWLSTYRHTSFPGAIEKSLLPLGRDVYARDCASCHGTYDRNLERPQLLEFPNWAGDVGTDMSRAEAFDPALAQAVGSGLYAAYIDAASTGRLVAPLLSGVWASAPYLVSGSVPTLRALLEPEARPARFPVGGHALDMEAVGIALLGAEDARYPPEVEPYSEPAFFDAATQGRSNRGHETEVEGLTARERDALIEYLKRL